MLAAVEPPRSDHEHGKSKPNDTETKAIASNCSRQVFAFWRGLAGPIGVCFSKRRGCSRAITRLFHLLGTEFEARFSVITKQRLGLKRLHNC